MTFDDLRLIGDEIHFEGELVAIMTTNPAPTQQARFQELLLEARDPKADEDEPVTPDKEISVLDELWSKATDTAKGGLLRMADLANIIARLKEAE